MAGAAATALTGRPDVARQFVREMPESLAAEIRAFFRPLRAQMRHSLVRTCCPSV